MEGKPITDNWQPTLRRAEGAMEGKPITDNLNKGSRQKSIVYAGRAVI